MSFSNSRKSNQNRNHQLPEVADRQPAGPTGECLDLSIDPNTEEIKNLDAYQVFLKRNLKPLAAPVDLLANIQARLAEIDAQKA
ncbi:hypothetical protein FUA23_01450 [Neolewinella aurantiaca]|uniref:Uncharacterized protein n=1 Tax=Neolewinella aurantiaca TaxID=2602767 RepID=A0A5C7G0U7_9BACT|nr:hypothetical protein [Neolewinella aurantiaca]TXF91389.1 hypothetical protein FUA23_01450 [Neolewinella aurantiaca]